MRSDHVIENYILKSVFVIIRVKVPVLKVVAISYVIVFDWWLCGNP